MKIVPCCKKEPVKVRTYTGSELHNGIALEGIYRAHNISGETRWIVLNSPPVHSVLLIRGGLLCLSNKSNILTDKFVHVTDEQIAMSVVKKVK